MGSPWLRLQWGASSTWNNSGERFQMSGSEKAHAYDRLGLALAGGEEHVGCTSGEGGREVPGTQSSLFGADLRIGPKLGGLSHAAVVCHEKTLFAELCESVCMVGVRGSRMPSLNRWILICSSCAGRPAPPPARMANTVMGEWNPFEAAASHSLT